MKISLMHKLSSNMVNIFFSLILLTSFGCKDKIVTPDNNEDIPKPAPSVLIDSLATENTVKLYINLKESAEKGVILGQQEAYLENSQKQYQSNCDISDVTGEYPLIAGCDIENLTNDDYAEGNWRYKQMENVAKWVKECHRNGVFVTFSWHFREPYKGEAFYTSEMSDAIKANAFRSILIGGENHTYYKKKLVLLADFFKSLKDNNGELIPIIFRPFHEFGGKWFWWGVPYYATSDEYIQNWKFTVDFLRTTCNVHNLIYAFTPGFSTTSEYLASYPGDDYVDILGFDSYTSNKFSTNYTEEANEVVEQLNIISTLAKERGKVAAFTEFGHDISDNSKQLKNAYTKFYLDILNRIDRGISYMMTWYNSTEKHFTPLAEDTEYIEDFKTFVKSDAVLTKGEIPSPLLP